MINKQDYKPLVSIALATYNGEKYLKEQIDSLLVQTYENFELVISDDGSTDATQSILEDYVSKDNRVSWSINNKARGFVSNFGEAIKKCKGEIVFLCDQDDFWYPEKIYKHVEEYKNQKIKWVYNELVITDEKRNHTGFLTDTLFDYWSKRKLLYHTWGSCILGCVTSYRRDLVCDIWPADKYAPGHDSWIQLVIFPAKSFHISEVLQEYRQHSANVVGLKQVDPQNLADLEKKAISDNFHYLKSLVCNKKIQFWKRVFFSFVYLTKKVRKVIKSF